MTQASFISQGKTLPIFGHVYDNSGNFKKLTGALVNTPAVKDSINAGLNDLTLALSTNDTSAQAPASGDLVTLTEQGGSGEVIFKGIIQGWEVDVEASGATFSLLVHHIVVEAGTTPFNTNYTAATDIGQMARDAIAKTKHLTADMTSIPNTGITAIFDFSGYTVLKALDECKKMAGPYYWWHCEEDGHTSFKQTNPGSVSADYTVKLGAEATAEKYTSTLDTLLNFIAAIGGVPSGGFSQPIASIYDAGHIIHGNASGYPIPDPSYAVSSPYGVMAYDQVLTYDKVVDQTTLDNIVSTLGQQFNRLTKQYVITLTNYSQRIHPGKVIRLWEPAHWPQAEAFKGSGNYSPNLVVMDVEITGPTQVVTAADMPVSVDDFKAMLDRMASATAVAATMPSTATVAPGSITPGDMGSTTPGIPAGLAVSSGLDNVAQVDNAYALVSWSANPTGDDVVQYRVRYKKVADATYSYLSTGGTSLKISGLIPGANYDFAVQAINNIGNASAFTADIAQAMATDSTAPAVPTGLAAYATPRGALVSWNGNSEADLQGYELQVSIGGGAYSLVTPGPTLSTSLVYTAPSGTAQGTSLAFQVRAVDWSGNFSAWSAASTAVNTDGIVFDELLAGNLKVFGTLTTGGMQTASSGARFVIDSTSIRAYDGSGTNYGAPSGAGVTVEISHTGTAFFAGSIASSTLTASAIVGTGTAPTYTAPANGFSIDPTNGFSWYTSSTLVAQWTPAGALTIYTDAVISGAHFKSDPNAGAAGASRPNWILSAPGPTSVSTTLFSDSIETADTTQLTVFRSIGSDARGSMAAWTAVTGVAFTISANVATPPATAAALSVSGHPDWQDATFLCRIKWVTSSQPGIVLHSDGTASNGIIAYVDGSNLLLKKVVAGVTTTVATVANALVTGTFYWLKLQGSGTTYTATLYNDSSGAIGAQRATCNGTISDAGVQKGQVGLWSGTTTQPQFGGAFSNVCLVTILPPLGWTVDLGGVSCEPAYAWSTQQHQDGTHSLSIWQGANDSNGSGAWISPAISATYLANATFTTAAYLRATNLGTTPTASIQLWDNGLVTTLGTQHSFTPTGTWTQYSFTDTGDWYTPDRGQPFKVKLQCGAIAGLRTSYFDLVTVARASTVGATHFKFYSQGDARERLTIHGGQDLTGSSPDSPLLTLSTNAYNTSGAHTLNAYGGIEWTDASGNELALLTFADGGTNTVAPGTPWMTLAFAGSVTDLLVSGNLRSQSKLRLAVHRAAALTLAAGDNVLPYDTVESDPSSGWDATNHRWTVPATGWYFVVSAATVSTSGQLPTASVYRNGAVASYGTDAQNGTGQSPAVILAKLMSLTKGDTVQGGVYCVSAGGALATTSTQAAYFNVHYLSE